MVKKKTVLLTEVYCCGNCSKLDKDNFCFDNGSKRKNEEMACSHINNFFKDRKFRLKEVASPLDWQKVLDKEYKWK